MNYSGNMPDWHQYNPPPPQPNINEASSSAQNVNSTHHYSFVSNINPATLNGPNLSTEGLEKHQNETAYNARHYQPHSNITSGQSSSDNAILPSMVQMPGCIGHYGAPTARNPMVDNLNTPVDSRNIPITSLNEELGYRNNQLPVSGPISHLNGPNLNISSVPAPIGPRNPAGGSSVSTVRQGPPSYIPCKGPCCNPPDTNIGYQHWDKFGSYQPHVPYRENARPTGYQADNRRYRADFNYRKDHFDGKDALPSMAQGADHRRNFPEYKYRKEPVIPRSYPPASTAVQNYPIQNYNYTTEYQKYPYPVKEYPKINGIAMQNSGVLKHQEQNVLSQQKYTNKSIQYQNVGYMQKGMTSNASGTMISSTQASYYNTQFQRNIPPGDIPRECPEQPDNPVAISRVQPAAIQNSYSRYQTYQQKIIMQKISMENHLREMTRFPGYQTHPKYKESVLKYQEILKLQQSIGYQNPTQQSSQTNVPVNSGVPPINLQFDQNGTLINTSYLPEAFPRVQQVMNPESNAENVHNQRKVHPLNMSKMAGHDIPAAQHIVNHPQNESSTGVCAEGLQNLEQFSVHKNLRQEQYKVQTNEAINYETLRTNIGEETTAHQKISKEFADKPELDVRQFLANWDETEDEDASGGNLPAVVLTESTPVVVVGYEDVSVAAKTGALIDASKQKSPTNEEINVDSSNKEARVLEAQDCLTISYPASENIEISKFCAEQSDVGSVVKPGSIIHCISNGPDEIPTIHIVDNVEIGNILKVSTETTGATFPRQDSLSLFEESTNLQEGNLRTTEHPASNEKQTCDSSTEYSTAVENVNNSVVANTKSSEKNNTPKVRQNNQVHGVPSRNAVDSTDGDIRKQSSFLNEEPHNPDDISLPDLPTSECTPLSTTLNTPIQSDNEDSSEQVEDLTISTNPIEVVQNSPIISFTHSPVRVEPYEHLDGQRGNGKSHVPLDFDFQEENQTTCDDLSSAKSALNAKDSEKGNTKSSKTYLAAKQHAEATSIGTQSVPNSKSSTNVSNKSCREEDCKRDSKGMKDTISDVANTSAMNLASTENIVFRVPDSQERLQPLQDDSLYDSTELNEQSLIDASEMIPLIPGEESEEPRMPVPPMEGNCLTKVIKNTLPITNLNVIESDDEKLDKNDDIWMEVGCMDKLMDCNINLENSENTSQERNFNGGKFVKIQKKHFKHFKRSKVPDRRNLVSTNSTKNVKDNTTAHTNKKAQESNGDSKEINQSAESTASLSSHSKNVSKTTANREISKIPDKQIASSKQESNQEQAHLLTDLRERNDKSPSCIGDSFVEENRESIGKDSVVIVREEEKTLKNNSPSFTKSFVTKNANSDFEIQVTNVNFKIKENDIRTELLTVKDKKQVTTKDSLDAIKIEINVSRADRKYDDTRVNQNVLEDASLEISNNKISSTSTEHEIPVHNKAKMDDGVRMEKLEDSNNPKARFKGEEERLTYEKSLDLKRKPNSNHSIEYLPIIKRPKTDNNVLTSFAPSTEFLTYDSNDVCSTTKYNYPSIVSAKTKADDCEEPDSLSLATHPYFEKNTKDDEFSIFSTKSSSEKYTDKESKKERSLVISNEKFLLTEQKRSSNAHDGEDGVLNVVNDKAIKPTRERKVSISNQGVNIMAENESQYLTNSKITESRLTEDIALSRESSSLNMQCDFMTSTALAAILDSPLDVTLPSKRLSPDSNTQNCEEKGSTLLELSRDIKKLQEEFDSIEAAGKNFCMRDIKRLQEQFDSIECAEKGFCSRKMQKSQEQFNSIDNPARSFCDSQTYATDRVANNPHRENPPILDFNNFDVAPNDANDSDDNHSRKWKKPRLNFHLEDGDLYESSSGFINPIFTSLDELENLNTVPVYTTKDGKITYSPNKKYTYRVLIMEARERERYSLSRESSYGRSIGHDYYGNSKIRKLHKKRHGSVESSRRRHGDYEHSRTSHESTTKHHYADKVDSHQRHQRRSKSRESQLENYKNKDEPNHDGKGDEEKRSHKDSSTKYTGSSKCYEGKPCSNEKSKSSLCRQSKSTFDIVDGREDTPSVADSYVANKNICYDDTSREKKDSVKPNNDRLSSYIQKFGAPCESIKKWNFDDVLGLHKPVDLSSERNKPDIVISVRTGDDQLSPGRSDRSQVQEKHDPNQGHLSPVESTNTIANKETAREVRADMQINPLKCTSKTTDLNVKSSLPDDILKCSDSHSYDNEYNELQLNTLQPPDEIPKSEENVLQPDNDHPKTISSKSCEKVIEESISNAENSANEPKTDVEVEKCTDLAQIEKEPSLTKSDRENAVELEQDHVKEIVSKAADVHSESIPEQNSKWTPEIHPADASISEDISTRQECKSTKDKQESTQKVISLMQESATDKLQSSDTKNDNGGSDNSTNSDNNNCKCNNTVIDDANHADNIVKLNLDQSKLLENSNSLYMLSNNDEMDDEDLSIPQLERIDPQEHYTNEAQQNSKTLLSGDNDSKGLNNTDNSSIDDTPPVLQEEIPILEKECGEIEKPNVTELTVSNTSNEDYINVQAKTDYLPSSLDNKIDKEVNVEQEHSSTSSGELSMQIENDKVCDSSSIEIGDELVDSSKSHPTVPQSIPKLVIKKSDTSVEGACNKTSTKLKVSLHPKIPKMIIRNVRSRPGTPTVEEISDVHTRNKVEPIVFKVDKKAHEEPCRSESTTEQSKLYDNKILKVKIKLEESSAIKTLKNENKEVWSSRKDSKKMVPKVTITKIKTSPKIQESATHTSYEDLTDKAVEIEENRNEMLHSDSHENYESRKTNADKRKEKIPKLKLRKHNSRSSSPDVGRTRHSSSSSEVTAKRYRRSGREEAKQAARRCSSIIKETISSNSEKKSSTCSKSDKIPKVIIKRTSANAEFKCELSKEGKDAIIKSARWQPAVKLHRSEVLDRLVKDLKNSRVTLTQALLKAEEERYLFSKRLPKLSRSNSTSNLTPVKYKQRRMSDYDNKPENTVDNKVFTTWYVKGNVQDASDIPKSVPEESKTLSEERQSMGNIEADIKQNLETSKSPERATDKDDKLDSDDKNEDDVFTGSSSHIERQEEFNEETQDTCEIGSLVQNTQPEPMQTTFTNASKIMCIIPRMDSTGLSRIEDLETSKKTPSEFPIKQEVEDVDDPVCSFRDLKVDGAKNQFTEDNASVDEVDCVFVKTERIVSTEYAGDCAVEDSNSSLRTKGVTSMDESMNSSVIKVDSSDDSQSTIEILPATPGVSQNEVEYRDFGLNENECERLYSADAIPTQFELELEITDNSNVDPLDVPLPKDMHSYRDDSMKGIDEQDCAIDSKHSPSCYDVKLSAARCKRLISDFGTPRRRSSGEKDLQRFYDDSNQILSEKASRRSPAGSIELHQLKKQEDYREKSRLNSVSFCCSDSLVKEVLAAKETLKKCLARSCSESNTVGKTKPKTAAEKKQGTSFSLDNLTDSFEGFIGFTKSEAESESGERDEEAKEDLRITITNTQRKTDSESNTEKSDQRHSKQYTSSTTGRKLKMKLPVSVERRSRSADGLDVSKEPCSGDDSSTTISLKKSKRIGQLVYENGGASSWLECEEQRRTSNTLSRDTTGHKKTSALNSASENSAVQSVSRNPKNPHRSKTTSTSQDHLAEEGNSKAKEDLMPILEPETVASFDLNLERDSSRSPPVITNQEGVSSAFQDLKDDDKTISSVDKASMERKCVDKECEEISVADIVTQLAFNDKATIKHRRYCILCERWFPTTARHRRHLTGYQHRHTELVQRRTIHALFMLFTGRPCPRLLTGNMARTDCSPGEATPLQIAVQDIATRVEQDQRDSRKQNNVNK